MTTQHMIAIADVIMGCFLLVALVVALGFAVFSMWQLYAELRTYRRRSTYTFTNRWAEVRQYAVGSGGGSGGAGGARCAYSIGGAAGGGGGGDFSGTVDQLEKTLPPGSSYTIVHPDGRKECGVVPWPGGGAGRPDHEGNEK